MKGETNGSNTVNEQNYLIPLFIYFYVNGNSIKILVLTLVQIISLPSIHIFNKEFTSALCHYF